MERFQHTFYYAPSVEKLAEGLRLPRDNVPVMVRDDTEEIFLGIDLPGGTEFTCTLSDSWEDIYDDAAYMTVDDAADVDRIYPELDEIIHEDERQERITDILINDFPDRYWRLPSSTGGRYHPPDEHWLHGQVLHTKRMIGGLTQLAKSAAVTDRYGSVSDESVQNALEAAFYHDLLKFGDEEDPIDGTVTEHAAHAADYFASHDRYDFDDEIIDCIERHGGPFYEESAPPETPAGHLIHQADMHSADQRSGYHVVQPSPELRFALTVTRLKHDNEDLAQGWEDYTVIPDADAVLDYC